MSGDLPVFTLSADELVALLASEAARWLPRGERKRLQRAMKVAQTAHQGQIRKHGEPYIAHPLRVALSLTREFGCHDGTTLCAALLHDVLEDAGDRFVGADLTTACGGAVLDLVEVLTAPPPVEGVELGRLKAEKVACGPGAAWLIKLADRIDNLRDACRLEGSSRDQMFWGRYERDTVEHYLPLADRLGAPQVRQALITALDALRRKMRRANNASGENPD